MRLCILIFLLSFQTYASEESVSDEFLSPFTTEAKYVLGLGTLSTLYLLYQEDKIVDPTQAEAKEDKPMGSASKYFDYGGRGIPNALYFLYMGTGYVFSGKSYYGSRANLMFKSSLYSGAVVTALKYTIREPRPNNSQERNSFPSGHAGMAFSFASTVAMGHPWPYGLLAYLYASGVAYSRINDNRHYLHDVVAGATIGASYGIALAQKRRLPRKTSYIFLPTDDLRGVQLAFHAKF